MSFKLSITESSNQAYDHWEMGEVRQRGPGQDLIVTLDLYKSKTAKDAGAASVRKHICIPEADVASVATFLADIEAAIRLKTSIECNGVDIDFTAAVDA